jgi:uncharacterized protein (UPF0276 family)
MVELVTPISHLFHMDSETGAKILDMSDSLECRDRSFDSSMPKQKLFHCEYQPIHKFSDDAFRYLEAISKNKPDLKLVSFHIASCCDQPTISNGMFELGGKKYDRDEMVHNAKENFSLIKNIFGDGVSIAVENNNYYPTEAYEYVTDPSFINEIVNECDLKILFDIAHAKVSCINGGINYVDYRDSLHLEKVIQLHICKHGIRENKQQAYDAHDYPTDVEFNEVDYLTRSYPNIKYLTIEYYKDFDNLRNSIERFRHLHVLNNQ